MEALILDADYAAKLFSKKELDTARERLSASKKDLRVLISTGWGTITFARQATSVTRENVLGVHMNLAIRSTST